MSDPSPRWQSVAQSPSTTTGGTPRHLPALDGLRGLALLGVLAFHANGALKGGYLGVDLFFVLSGFLITRILLAEYRATGTIALSTFWVRRARRLLPALLVLMPAIALYAHLVARPEELAGIRADALATLGYFANWRAILSNKSYFELFLSPSPLEHTWSLAIEEQFYLFWPLIVLSALRWRGRRGLLFITLALAFFSVLAMLTLFQPARTTRVYYGTDTRAAGLLSGAAFSVIAAELPALSRRAVRWLDRAAVFAIAGLAFAWATIDGHDFFLYRGGFWAAEALSLVLLACAFVGPSSLVARALSWRPLRALGAVSYGAYLWHWPVNLVITTGRFHVHGSAVWMVRFAVTAAIATVSYYFLEQPIRRHGLPFGRARWVVPLAFGLSACSVVIGTHAKPQPVAPIPAVVHEAAAASIVIRFRVKVLGDSTANAIAGTLRSVASPDVVVETAGKDGLNLIDADEFHFPPVDPKVDATVVAVGGAFLYGIHVRGKWTSACHPRWHEFFEKGLDDHLREILDSPGSLWVGTVPYPLGPYDDAAHRKQVDCINASIRKTVARFPKVSILDIGELICPKRDCEKGGGLGLRPDGVHLHVPAAGPLGHDLFALLDHGAARPATDSTTNAAPN